jgi:oxygen-independent coproporphyrinogen-3 oxidase
LIERVMCDLALDLSPLAWGLGAAEVIAAARRGLEELERAGVVALSGERLRVTPAGRRFVRQVAACFDAYLPRSEGRHSVAV